MINDVNIYPITEDITVANFLAQFKNIKLTSRQFLDLAINRPIKIATEQSLNLTTNLQHITAAYVTQEDLDKNVTNQTPDNVVIKKGTEVGLPNSAIKRNTTNTVQPDVFNMSQNSAFIASKLRELFQDPNYTQSIAAKDGTYFGRKDNNDISVFIWIRSVNSWYNISAFVENLRTSVNATMGTFEFTVSPIKGIYNQAIGDIEIGWGFDDVRGYDNGSIRNQTVSKTVISKYKKTPSSTMLPDPSANLIRETFFFNTVLQENDLVYIRFEKLDAEKENIAKKTVFGENDVPGNIYDMIGLLDNVNTTTTPDGVRTSIQGRDLMKMLIEDGSIFFPEQFAFNIFQNEDSKLAKRNMMAVESSALLSQNYSFKSIELIVKFIFNQFSNIGYIPLSALSGYGNKLIKNKYELKKTQLKNSFGQILEGIDVKFNAQERDGLWQIVDLVIDPTAAVRVLADNTIAEDNGSIINSIRKICQQPFVEFFGDTYGDRYVYTVRKPPTDEQSYRSLVYGDPVYDKLSDGINYIGKDAQRKIKEDREKTLNLLSRPCLINDTVIDIDETDVISDNFSYHNEAYSWYRLIPRGLGATNETLNFLLAPVVSFDEYANVWGSKTYTMECNYTPSVFLDDSGVKAEQNYVEAQTFYDLRYLIQSNAYLPFTRFGSIVMTGNRLIKRGYFIYYKPTNEIFYVDGVTQIRGVGVRQTILQVSRGMREPFIKGKKIFGITENVSYFSIVNTKFDGAPSINKTQFLKNWKVNTDVFNFFLQRRQWDEQYSVK